MDFTKVSESPVFTYTHLVLLLRQKGVLKSVTRKDVKTEIYK